MPWLESLSNVKFGLFLITDIGLNGFDEAA
ncbi:hypothetical protein XMV242_001787 [Marinobacterium sp. xm-v-242]|nr:hypothetical protein [Marinobacterium sp. xm-v-242]NRP78088.1 hypothetical protein [Marinobacterium sp. xm-m-383]